jgi:hypothetical protein
MMDRALHVTVMKRENLNQFAFHKDKLFSIQNEKEKVDCR